MRISFTVIGNPVPKGRPRFFRKGNFIGKYADPKTKEAEQDFLLQALNYKPPLPLEGAIAISLTFYLKIPVSLSKRKIEAGILPYKRPDLDNYIKTVLDSLNSVFFRDDSQIVSLKADKIYGNSPRTEVLIETIGEK